MWGRQGLELNDLSLVLRLSKQEYAGIRTLTRRLFLFHYGAAGVMHDGFLRFYLFQVHILPLQQVFGAAFGLLRVQIGVEFRLLIWGFYFIITDGCSATHSVYDFESLYIQTKQLKFQCSLYNFNFNVYVYVYDIAIVYIINECILINR